MNAAALLLATLLGAPTAEVVTSDDQVTSGALVSLGAQGITLEADGKTTTVPFENVLEVRLPSAGENGSEAPSDLTVWLRDGGRLNCRQVGTKDRSVEVDSISAGPTTFPLGAVKAIRFRPSDPALDEKWNELIQSEPERDLVVVRNADVLDRLEGTISGIDADNLTFLVGDTRVPIPRSRPKLYGVVLGRSPAASHESLGELRFRNGDLLPVRTMTLEGESMKVATTSGGEVSVSLASLQAIDFGRDKVQLLSKLALRDKQTTTWFGDAPLFDVLLDRSFEGVDRPIRIDRQTFRSGLVIRSRTRLTWRLGGDFRRLTAIAGIEQARRSNTSGGVVDLTISADGKELFSQRISKSDPPIPLDLDLAGARELTVFVDFGGDDDTGDHLALGDARLIK